MSTPDTVFAPATPAGGALCILRVSGPGAAAALTALTGREYRDAPRQMRRAALASGGRRLDDAMAVFYPSPASYTGEDMCELFLHGSPAVLRAVQGALLGMGLRPAEPGEFTRRAFLNGKLDLAEAEAVADLIAATADRAADAALEQLTGRLSREVLEIEAGLLDAFSAVSAAIDYPEEMEEDVFAALPGQLQKAEANLAALTAQGGAGRVLREGLRVALAGRPNAGKSSLLNAMLGYERAIVTEEPGTTRDVLEETMSFDGIPLRLFDTAGIREAESAAEREGVSRARDALQKADIVLLLLDGSAPLSGGDAAMVAETRGRTRILIRTKRDLPMLWEDAFGESVLSVSARTGEGLGPLFEEIRSLAGPVEGAYVTNVRHIAALSDALAAVRSAKTAPEADCAATDIREALLALGRITGREVDESVIGRIFERFCVGK